MKAILSISLATIVLLSCQKDDNKKSTPTPSTTNPPTNNPIGLYRIDSVGRIDDFNGQWIYSHGVVALLIDSELGYLFSGNRFNGDRLDKVKMSDSVLVIRSVNGTEDDTLLRSINGLNEVWTPVSGRMNKYYVTKNLNVRTAPVIYEIDSIVWTEGERIGEFISPGGNIAIYDKDDQYAVWNIKGSIMGISLERIETTESSVKTELKQFVRRVRDDGTESWKDLKPDLYGSYYYIVRKK